jgi:hypothetical protein
MTIEQTVEIPEDRPVSHLHLDLPLPQKHPSGTVKVEVKLRSTKPGFFSNLFASRFYKNFDKFYGCLKGNPVFEGDSVEIVRSMREEWDRPWDGNNEAQIRP